MVGISPKPVISVRWLVVKDDLDAVMRIENVSFDEPWRSNEFKNALKKPRIAGNIGLVDGVVRAYCIFGCDELEMTVLNIAVEQSYRRMGIGGLLVNAAMTSDYGGSRAIAHVRETNLDAQLFFKAIGFRCVKIAKNYYRDVENAYVFVKKRKDGSQ